MKLVVLLVVTLLAACSTQTPVVDQPLPTAVYQDGVRLGYTPEEIARNQSKASCQRNPQVYEWVPCLEKGDGAAGDD